MIGTHIGRYRIDGELGRGGMGVVYRGTQVTLDRTVAVKMLPGRLADGEMRERFRREALTLARLAHPNIIHIYDVEEADGDSFIMMEFVGGGSLGDLLASDGPLSPARSVEILGPVLSALQAAHVAGIVHRDIKPDNILFSSSGRPKLTDFGIAHMRDGGSRTRTGVMLGTPYYMSPEQAQGRPVTATADIYAVGVVLFEMLTGRVPFTGEDPVSVALKHVQQAPPSLAELRPGLPRALSEVVERALQKTPSTRFTSAAAMQDALESALGAAGAGPAISGAGAAIGVVSDETRPWGDSSSDALDASDSGAPSVSGSGQPEAAAFDPNSPGGGSGAVSGADLASSGASGSAGLAASGASAPAGPPADSGSGAPAASGPSWGPATGGGRMAADTGRRAVAWLGRPAWAGFPMAFWAGAALVAVTLLYAGAGALMGDGSTGDDRSSNPERSLVGPTDAVPTGPGTPRRTILPGDDRSDQTATPLTPEERSNLQRIVSGDDESSTDEQTSDTDDRTVVDRTIVDDTDDDGPTLDDLRRELESEDDTGPSARALVEELVNRQIQAVESQNRALFLRDFHPDVRDEAADEFDDAYEGVASIRSTPSNLEIEFPEPGVAYVTFDVVVRFVVRGDGRTETAAFQEDWELVREGNRWWIIEWN